ncbi:efflux transporter outer membrane subunit [Chitinibacter sp. SCUT-21]|uniref:efflux transporter outer membrane subunit n=1 Tax=Chitinibacter sp. SCUT-21 TaxID=2970891 RepID=UPI0035A69C43
MTKTILSLCIAGLLSACAFTPDYTPPSTELPVSSVQNVVAKEWWTQFNDPTLTTLIEAARKNNQNLAMIQAKVDEARAVLGITSSEQLPRIGLGGSAGQATQSKELGYPAYTNAENYKLVGQVSWELDIWGRVRNLSAAARDDLFAAQYNQDAAISSLSAEVAQAYFNLRALDAKRQITENTIKSREEAYALRSKRFKGGVTSELDVRQAEVELANAQSSLPEILRAIASTEGALSILIGQSPKSLIEDNIPRGLAMGYIQPAPSIPAELGSDLLLRRPDIAAAESSLRANRARIQAARAAYLPRISLTGLLGVESNDLGALFNSSARTWSFAGNLAMPLFDNGLTASQIDQAKARERQAAAAYQLAIQTAFAETRTALASNLVIGDKVKADQTQVDALNRQLKLANLRYDNGFSSYLEVLDAERNLFGAQISLVNAQRDQLNYRVELFKALGGGWEKPAEGEETQAPH